LNTKALALEQQLATSKKDFEWMDSDGSFESHFLAYKFCPRFVRGCPRLSGLHWCLSAVVRGMGCFLAILLSADVRGWILNIKSHQYGDPAVRGCPRPPGSATSCGKALVRGRYGFLLGFDYFFGGPIDCKMYIFRSASALYFRTVEEPNNKICVIAARVEKVRKVIKHSKTKTPNTDIKNLQRSYK